MATFVTVGALLLLVAGLARIIAPKPASDALGVVGLPSHPLLVRVGSAAEGAIAVTALIAPGPGGPLLLGVPHGAFAVFIVLLRRQSDAGSCGCFGAEGETPSIRHVIVNGIVAAGCVLATLVGSPSTLTILRSHVSLGLASFVLCSLGAWLGGLVLGATPLGADR